MVCFKTFNCLNSMEIIKWNNFEIQWVCYVIQKTLQLFWKTLIIPGRLFLSFNIAAERLSVKSTFSQIIQYVNVNKYVVYTLNKCPSLSITIEFFTTFYWENRGIERYSKLWSIVRSCSFIFEFYSIDSANEQFL